MQFPVFLGVTRIFVTLESAFPVDSNLNVSVLYSTCVVFWPGHITAHAFSTWFCYIAVVLFDTFGYCCSLPHFLHLLVVRFCCILLYSFVDVRVISTWRVFDLIPSP